MTADMFATDYLKDYAGADDWVCVEDVCCSYSPTISRGYDVSAWWSPSRKIVAFGNNWGDVPDMPADTCPTDKQVWAWVREHPGWLQRTMDAARRRKEAWKAKMDATEKFFERHGVGVVHAELRAPDGFVKVIDHTCGIHGPLFMLPLAIDWMRREMPPGSVLQRLTVARKKPVHRGELKLAK